MVDNLQAKTFELEPVIAQTQWAQFVTTLNIAFSVMWYFMSL